MTKQVRLRTRKHRSLILRRAAYDTLLIAIAIPTAQWFGQSFPKALQELRTGQYGDLAWTSFFIFTSIIILIVVTAFYRAVTHVDEALE